MKIYKVWLIIIMLYLIGISVINQNNTQEFLFKNDLLYFNGYLNFCFNGITKLFIDDNDTYKQVDQDMKFSKYEELEKIQRLKEQEQKKNIREIRINSFKKNDVVNEQNLIDKLEDTAKKAGENSLNKAFKDLTGRDLDDIQRELKNLQIK